MKFATLDCETDPFRHGRPPVPFAWGLYTGESYRELWGVGRESEVATWIEELDPETIVYAHNGGRFDFHYLLPYFDAGELLTIRGRIAEARLRGRRLRDSYLLVPAALSAGGAKLGIDYAKMERRVRERHRREILTYLRADCEALHELVSAAIAEHGEVLTLPAGALKTWLRLADRKRPTLSPRLDSRLRPFYAGGRCEAIETGIVNEPLTVYDVNSAYPAAMLGEHPIGKPATTRRLPDSPARLRLAFARFRGWSRGALWVREPDGSLSFPRDARGTFLATGHEIAAGLETGTLGVDRVELVYQFRESVSFADFVLHYYAQRKRQKAAGDQVGQLISKLTMNSLYGKFGQDGDARTKHAIARHTDELAAEGFKISGTLGPWWLGAKPNPQRWAFLHVAVAASITGEVRARLWRALLSADRPVYCDTDSIVARGFRGELGAELGQWKVEAELPGPFAIAGKKLYAGRTADGHEKIASKGAKLSLADVFTIARGGRVRWDSEAPAFRLAGGATFVSRTLGQRGN